MTPAETAAHSPSAATEEQIPVLTEIAGIAEPVIVRYFNALNAGDFVATASLFSEDGALQPPFESPIVGREAIVTYLETEARNLVLRPRQGKAQILDNGCTEIQVSGKVQTPLFGVNVSWLFILSPNRELFLAKIKLLASPQELLNLRQ